MVTAMAERLRLARRQYLVGLFELEMMNYLEQDQSNDAKARRRNCWCKKMGAYVMSINIVCDF